MGVIDQFNKFYFMAPNSSTSVVLYISRCPTTGRLMSFPIIYNNKNNGRFAQEKYGNHK